MDDQTKQEIKQAVVEAFAASVDQGRYVDISRIPLICQSIVGIDKKLDELVTRAEFKPVQLLVYGLVSLILSGVIGALLMLIFKS